MSPSSVQLVRRQGCGFASELPCQVPGHSIQFPIFPRLALRLRRGNWEGNAGVAASLLSRGRPGRAFW